MYQHLLCNIHTDNRQCVIFITHFKLTKIINFQWMMLFFSVISSYTCAVPNSCVCGFFLESQTKTVMQRGAWTKYSKYCVLTKQTSFVQECWTFKDETWHSTGLAASSWIVLSRNCAIGWVTWIRKNLGVGSKLE